MKHIWNTSYLPNHYGMVGKPMSCTSLIGGLVVKLQNPIVFLCILIISTLTGIYWQPIELYGGKFFFIFCTQIGESSLINLTKFHACKSSTLVALMNQSGGCIHECNFSNISKIPKLRYHWSCWLMPSPIRYIGFSRSQTTFSAALGDVPTNVSHRESCQVDCKSREGTALLKHTAEKTGWFLWGMWVGCGCVLRTKVLTHTISAGSENWWTGLWQSESYLWLLRLRSDSGVIPVQGPVGRVCHHHGSSQDWTHGDASGEPFTVPPLS